MGGDHRERGKECSALLGRRGRFFFSSRRRHTSSLRDWSSDVCSSDLTRQFKAMAANTANSTAFRFNTGNTPGIPRHTGHTLVLGGSPKRVEQEQNIFDAVRDRKSVV